MRCSHLFRYLTFEQASITRYQSSVLYDNDDSVEMFAQLSFGSDDALNRRLYQILVSNQACVALKMWVVHVTAV